MTHDPFMAEQLSSLKAQAFGVEAERRQAEVERQRPIDADDVMRTFFQRVKAFEAGLEPNTRLAIELNSGEVLKVDEVKSHGRAMIEISGSDGDGRKRALLMHFSQLRVDLCGISLDAGEDRKPIGFN